MEGKLDEGKDGGEVIWREKGGENEKSGKIYERERGRESEVEGAGGNERRKKKR